MDEWREVDALPPPLPPQSGQYPESDDADDDIHTGESMMIE